MDNNKNNLPTNNANNEILRTDEIGRETVKRDGMTDAVLGQQIDFHKRIFPNKSTKEIIEYQTKLLKQRGEANLENHRMLYEFQRQSVKTALDAVLIQGKGKVISETNQSFLKEMDIMSERLLETVENNEAILEKKFLALDNMKVPEMKKTKQELLLKLNGIFHEEMFQLIQQYRQIKNDLV